MVKIGINDVCTRKNTAMNDRYTTSDDKNDVCTKQNLVYERRIYKKGKIYERRIYKVYERHIYKTEIHITTRVRFF